MIGRVTALLGILLLAGGCLEPVPYNSSNPNAPRTRCLQAPQRSENYTQERPMFYLFCTESP